MNKDKIIKDLKERNDKLANQYRLRDIRCVHLEMVNETLRQENKQLKEEKEHLKEILNKVRDYDSAEYDYIMSLLGGKE